MFTLYGSVCYVYIYTRGVQHVVLHGANTACHEYPPAVDIITEEECGTNTVDIYSKALSYIRLLGSNGMNRNNWLNFIEWRQEDV